MTRAHFFSKATDSQGNIVPGTTVTLYQPGSLALLDEAVYTAATGSLEHANPWTVNDGLIDFYLTGPRQVRIGLRSPNGTERFTDNVDVFPDPTQLVQTPGGLHITNVPLPGDFLQATSNRTATWVNAAYLETSAVTPKSVVLNQTFDSQTLGDLTLRTQTGATQAPAGYPSVLGDTLPPGYAFTRALDWATTQPLVLGVPTELFPEAGLVIFVYKVLSPTTGTDSARLRVAIDGTQLWTQTPTDVDLDAWRIGYLANIPPGTHTIRVTHLPAATDSRVLLGSLIVQYGGNVPPHTHQAAGLLATAVGQGAAASFDHATAVGGDSVVSGTRGTAVGARSRSAEDGTALGADSTATEGAVAVGSGARVAPSAVRGVALGIAAGAQATEAVAVGAHAIAAGETSIALGPGSRAGAQDAIAIGAEATANGIGSIALGVGATTQHEHAVALGPDALTTADHQLMLGTAEDAVVVPGHFQQTGLEATIGAVDGQIGFFGVPPVERPVVIGSRGGNVALGALITVLADLGLVHDETTA